MNKKVIVVMLVAVALACGSYYFLNNNRAESLESLNAQMIKECGRGKVISGTPECVSVLNKIHTLYPTNGVNISTVATDTAPIAMSTPTEPIVGGDRDAHGCIPSAGYSWCEAKNKCLRPWEETCSTAR